MSRIKACHAILDAMLADIDRAIKRSKVGTSKQIHRVEDLDYFRSVAYSWFHTRKRQLHELIPELSVSLLENGFTTILEASSKKASRLTYQHALKNCRQSVVAISKEVVSIPLLPQEQASNVAPPPDFSILVTDPLMREILKDRWIECRKCVEAEAYLAATVMMGGLLETLFVACANRLQDKSPLFKAKSTPIDPKTQKPMPLQQWTLRPYIDVAHDLGWITRSGKDVAEVLRDYRNYVHPEKQRSHGITLNAADARMFWDVTKNLVEQLLVKFGGTS